MKQLNVSTSFPRRQWLIRSDGSKSKKLSDLIIPVYSTSSSITDEIDCKYAVRWLIATNNVMQTVVYDSELSRCGHSGALDETSTKPFGYRCGTLRLVRGEDIDAQLIVDHERKNTHLGSAALVELLEAKVELLFRREGRPDPANRKRRISKVSGE